MCQKESRNLGEQLRLELSQLQHCSLISSSFPRYDLLSKLIQFLLRFLIYPNFFLFFLFFFFFCIKETAQLLCEAYLEKKKMDVVMSPWEKGVRSYPDTAWGAPQHKAATDHIASAHTPPPGCKGTPSEAACTSDSRGRRGFRAVPSADQVAAGLGCLGKEKSGLQQV